MGDDGALRIGERVLLIDAKDRRYLVRLREGATFHTHSGLVAHADLIGRREGSTVEGSTGRQFLVAAPHARRRGAEDAARRPGHLPEGPRCDPARRRRRPRDAGARVRGGVRCALHDAPARRGLGARLRAPRGVRRDGARERRRIPRRGRRLHDRDPRRDRRHRRTRARSRAARHADTLGRLGGGRERPSSAAGSSSRTCRRSTRPRSCARPGGGTVGPRGDLRAAAAKLARRAALGATGPPHGRPHRVPHDRTAPRRKPMRTEGVSPAR